jgi:hypothetical protein
MHQANIILQPRDPALKSVWIVFQIVRMNELTNLRTRMDLPFVAVSFSRTLAVGTGLESRRWLRGLRSIGSCVQAYAIIALMMYVIRASTAMPPDPM